MTCLFVLIDSRLEPQRIDLEFIEWLGENGIPFALIFTKADKQSVKLAGPDSCYTELLNLDGKQKPQEPFNSSDHHSYYVSAKDLNSKQDARNNAAQLINRAVSAVEKSAGTCKVQTASATFGKDVCKVLGGIQTCVLTPANAGYYVVTKDTADGAFVTFVRFD